MLKDTLHFVFVVLQVLAVVYGLYYFSTSIYGIVEKFNRKPTRNYLPLKRFAVFIPAHNEERVIGNIVENLKQLNYPADGYDVFVIADNCTDDTAHIAAAGEAMCGAGQIMKKGAKALLCSGHSKRYCIEKIRIMMQR